MGNWLHDFNVIFSDAFKFHQTMSLPFLPPYLMFSSQKVKKKTKRRKGRVIGLPP